MCKGQKQKSMIRLALTNNSMWLETKVAIGRVREETREMEVDVTGIRIVT